MERLWIALGALAGLATVATSALAAHAFAGLDAAARDAISAAIQIQGWHAIALLFCGLWTPRGGRLAHFAATGFAVGLILFCAGVYSHAIWGLRLPMVAPTGGSILMLAWLTLALSAFTARR
jgi:uncharacterized membrane protein YgdD (TMEM256/DUF423 family)